MMTTKQLNTDYLIIGAGAAGMAFADTLLTDTDAKILIVDLSHKPGGHWNVAYPFVTLHQPSQYYGVSSKELSKGGKDTIGLNKGLNGLATGDEINAYFDEVMRERFLPSGRVQYFPMCKYTGEGKFHSVMTGQQYQVEISKKTVDTTYLKTTVPATHTPNFSVAEGIPFMPINELPNVTAPPNGYVVIGGGKTGIDACLWLLQNRVEPDDIRWIMPRDAWLLNRKNTQPTEEFFMDSLGAQASQMEAIAAAEDIDDLFTRLEKSGVMLRLDENVWPRMFHGATVSELELEQLRCIKNIVRKGRVQRIERDKIVLQEGEIETDSGYMHIDCSASAIGNLEPKAIFEGELITPQAVRSYQPVFSAALIAHVEATFESERQKNGMCHVAILPNHVNDWVKMTAANMMNQYLWSRDENMRTWLYHNRLDGFTKLIQSIKPEETEKLKVMQRIKDAAMPAMGKLQQFIAQIDAAEKAA